VGEEKARREERDDEKNCFMEAREDLSIIPFGLLLARPRFGIMLALVTGKA
jgi:hypothetical protein